MNLYQIYILFIQPYKTDKKYKTCKKEGRITITRHKKEDGKYSNTNCKVGILRIPMHDF